MRYIDPHTHIHTLTWNDHELVSMAGLEVAITTAGNPAVHHQVFEGKLSVADLEGLWTDAIMFSRMVYKSHFFNVKVAIGIHQLAASDDVDGSIELLKRMLNEPEVVALGEVGLDPTQYFGVTWTLDEQSEWLRRQFEVAKEAGKPVILHTPTQKRHLDFMIQLDEAPPETQTDEPFKMPYLRRDIDILRDVGFDLEKVVVDHSDETTIDWILSETPCQVGISVGLRLRSIRPRDVADMVAKYGPDRLMINSDAAGHSGYDPISVPRTILDMRRLEIPEDVIKKVVWDNPRDAFALDV